MQRPPNSIQWFKDTLSQINSPDKANTNLVNKIDNNSLGKMFLFIYDPKLKDVLPYYDIYPLIFPIEVKQEGFLGINLHYLPPMMRLQLVKALMDVANNKKNDDTTKLLISYKLLSAYSRYSSFLPCLKMYLWTQVKSKFLLIPSNNWEVACYLPLQKFQKATNDIVWRDSINKIK